MPSIITFNENNYISVYLRYTILCMPPQFITILRAIWFPKPSDTALNRGTISHFRYLAHQDNILATMNTHDYFTRNLVVCNCAKASLR